MKIVYISDVDTDESADINLTWADIADKPKHALLRNISFNSILRLRITSGLNLDIARIIFPFYKKIEFNLENHTCNREDLFKFLVSVHPDKQALLKRQLAKGKPLEEVLV